MASAFVIAAPSSGSGKTSVTLGLMQALKNRSLAVQAFKCGPDYIDTMLHSHITGMPGINLDLFFNTPEQLDNLWTRYADNNDVCIVEGVMGLFDGAIKQQGSTAHLAKTLNLPVVLVVDAKATAYSIAPLLYGYKNFDPDVRLAGVIFNRVGSASHFRYLQEAAVDAGVPVFGYVENNANFVIPERYLGLNFDGMADIEKAVCAVSQSLANTVDIELLLANTSMEFMPTESEPKPMVQGNMNIAIARDESFTFTYHENIRQLQSLGEVRFFSPLHDSELPEADFVYLAGGYPEKFPKELATNNSMKNSIKQFIERGGAVLAECGGMMYLGKSIISENGQKHAMCGVFNFESSLQQKKLHLGYRKFSYKNELFVGHEFHYSTLLEDENDECIGNFENAYGEPVNLNMYQYKNCKASYMHFYWGNNNIYPKLFTEQ